MKEKNFIYSLVGNFPSRRYSLIEWKHMHYEKSSYKFPLSILAYLKELTSKGAYYKITFLVPHSIFLEEASLKKDLTNFKKLKRIFKEDLFNYYTNKLNFLLDRLINVKNKNEFLNTMQDLISFIKNATEWDEKYLNNLEIEINKKLEDTLELRKIKDHFIRTWKNKFKVKIENLMKEKDKEIKELLEGKVNIEIIPSVGVYKINKSETIKYNIESSKRLSYFFSIFVKDILYNLSKNTKFILDVSTGLNFLVVEMTEAFNNACVLSNFFYIGKENKHSFFIFSTEPVIGRPNQFTRNFWFEEINRKAFFEKPLKYSQLEEKLKSIPGNLRSTVKESVEKSIYLFNIVYFTLPLCILLQEYKENLKIRDDKEFIKILENLNNRIYNIFQEIEIQFNSKEGEIKIQDINLSFKEIRDFMFMLMLGANLAEKLKNYRILNHFKKLISLKFLKEFGKVLKKYNLELNYSFLKREIDLKYEDIEKFLRKKSYESESKIKLIELKGKKAMDPFINTEKFKRNFLAHCGLEDNITILIKNKNEVFLGYDDKYIDKIYNFVINL